MSLLDTASLVITPNGYKEGKLYSVVPSDGSGDLNVTRATTATRVNASGLVELVPYNLLTYSEQLDNGAWTTFNASVTANTTTAPNGTTTADTITSNDSGGGDVYRSITVNGTYTLSAYFKAGTTNLCRLGSTASGLAEFNLSTETYTLLSGVSASITSVGSGWYRCTLTINNTSSTLLFLSSYDVTGKTVYAWGAQLVEGSTAKDYQKTETRLNIPRLDYSNGTCPSILVEPQRTNIFKYSEQFDNASWTKVSSSVTANSIIAPDGNTTADKLTATGTSIPCVYQASTLSGTYTVSSFVKKGTSNYCWLYLHSLSAIFNLDNGTIVSGSNATITSVGNGWYRVTLTGTLSTNDIDCIGVSDGTTINGITGQYIYIWGAQLEAGSYATSYIPTTSASVTRNADVISKTGISSLIGQTEGTIFFEIANIANDGGVKAISLSNGTINQTIEFAYYGNNEYNFIVRNGGTTYNFPSSLTDVTQMTKFAFAYKQNDFALYINGTQVNTSLSGNVPSSMDRLQFDWANGGYGFYGNANTLSLWKTRLTNTQLAQLTTI